MGRIIQLVHLSAAPLIRRAPHVRHHVGMPNLPSLVRLSHPSTLLIRSRQYLRLQWLPMVPWSYIQDGGAEGRGGTMRSSLAAETLSFRENFPNDHLHPNAIGRYNHDPFCLFSALSLLFLKMVE